MSGFALTLNWEDDGVQQLCKAAISRIDDMTPVMADFSGRMLSETMERFDLEQAPDGTGWQKLSDATEEMRAEAGKWPGKKLQVDGTLRSSIQGGHDAAGVDLASTNVEYAAIHNFGGTIKPKKGKALKFGSAIVSQVKIPRRQYLGFGDDDIDYFNESVTGWVVTGKVG
ncbi:phage virion morphogenesis protein [Desulfobacter vibrioformis]|uniref:phage virion morphogenesis protein n=1 Tax=Desulfobacter vibrioformis TaxID=34031 RepID=UPI00069054FC|nr:phage virion morphogenesis protein [Desulfobacter vibrioformis]